MAGNCLAGLARVYRVGLDASGGSERKNSALKSHDLGFYRINSSLYECRVHAASIRHRMGNAKIERRHGAGVVCKEAELLRVHPPEHIGPSLGEVPEGRPIDSLELELLDRQGVGENLHARVGVDEQVP